MSADPELDSLPSQSPPLPRYSPLAVSLALVVPLLVQAPAIATLLIVTNGDSFKALLASIASLVWLRLSEDKSVQEFGELRAGRRLFAAIGSWMGRVDAVDKYDAALAETLMLAPNVEHSDFMEVATASGIANTVRAAMAVLLRIYIAFVVVTYVASLLSQN